MFVINKVKDKACEIREKSVELSHLYMLQKRKKEREMLEEKFTKKCAVSDLY